MRVVSDVSGVVEIMKGGSDRYWADSIGPTADLAVGRRS